MFSFLVFWVLVKLCKCDYPSNGIVLVPGIAGSALFSTLDNAYLPSCSDKPITQPRCRLWIYLFSVLPYLSKAECWMEKLKLSHILSENCNDPLPMNCTINYIPQKGVLVETTPPGEVSGIDYLETVDSYGIPMTKYFHDLLEVFRKLSYIDGDTLMGYAYDWRYPTWQLNLTSLKTLIEDFSERHPNKKVVIIAHSLGCIVANRFLNLYVDAAWKKKYIESFISINGAYGGSHKTIHTLLSGNSEYSSVNFFGLLNISIIPNRAIRDTERTYGSLYNIIPNPTIFNRDDVVVHVENTSLPIRKTGPIITVNNFTLSSWWLLLPKELQCFAIDGLRHLYEEKLDYSLADPQVPVHCLNSIYDFPTTEYSFSYPDLNFDKQPKVTYTYGDNTVTKQSSSLCSLWRSVLTYRTFKNRDHMEILFDKEFNEYVASLVLNFKPDDN